MREHPSGVFEIHVRDGGALRGISKDMILEGQPARRKFRQVDF